MAIQDYYVTLEKYSKTSVSNGRGGFVDTWVKASEFEGLINQTSSREIEAAMKIDIDTDSKLYCPTSVILTNDNRIKWGTQYYRVVSEPKNTVNRGHHLKIFLKKSFLD